MLQRRLIPSLLVDGTGHLVKTTRFSDRVYIGDPRNACYVLSGFQADEIFLLDIDASSECYSPNLSLIRSIAQFSSVPLAVGGGIQSLGQIESILSLGVERVILSSALYQKYGFLNDAVKNFGSSSISVILNHYSFIGGVPMGCFGKINSSKNLESLLELAQICYAEGAGELIVCDVSSEGTRSGFDCGLFKLISEKLSIPTIALGGGYSSDHVRQLFQSSEVAGASLGSCFVYAPGTCQVLINYPQFKSQVSLVI
jgi:cyclase